MKFKNSYLLLIAMVIFLLISIGSVCASENVTADSDSQLASADDSVVLADNGNGSTQEKINTEVVCENQEYKDNESVVIPVEVKYNESNTLNISASNLTVLKNGKSIKFTYNNTTGITLIDKLAIGNHTLDIWYLGNAVYNNSTSKIILSIFGNNTLIMPSGINSDGNSVDVPINLTDGVHDNTHLLNDSNTIVILKYNDINATVPIDWNEVATNHIISISNLENKIPSTLIVNYTEGNKSIIKEVAIKYTTLINASDVDANENEVINISVVVLDVNNAPISNITKNNFTITGVKNYSYNSTTNILTITKLTKGIYPVTIIYTGNENYNASTKTININVRGSVVINTKDKTVKVNSTKNGTIVLNITNGVDIFEINKTNINLTITYKDGNLTKTVNATILSVENGTITFTYDGDNITSGNLTIIYNNGDVNATKKITMKRIYNVKIEIIKAENQYLSGNFTFKLVDLDNSTISLKGKKLSLTTTGRIKAGFSATIDENNIASFKNSNLYEFDQNNNNLAMNRLNVGNHIVELTTSDSLVSTKVTTNLTITKAKVTIKMDNYNEYYGSNKNLTFTVTNSESGEAMNGIILKLHFPKISKNYFYVSTNVNGKAHISVKGVVGGTYNLTASTNDTKNVVNASIKSTMTIKKIPVVISGKNVKIYYNSGPTYTIKVTKNGKGISGAYVFVRLYSTSKNYTDYLFKTNSNGQILFSASLGVGNHKIIVTSADARYQSNQITKTITVKKASAKIKAPKVTDYYKGGKYFNIKLSNTKNKKGIYNAKVNIKVFITSSRYYNYNGYTGANGKIKLSLDNLRPGTYYVVISGADNKNYKAKKIISKIVIKKAPTKLVVKKISAKKGSEKYFKVKVINKKTKKVISKVAIKVKVYTGKKYKTYTLKTNAKGIANLNVGKLKVGKHKVVVNSANKYCVAKTAKSTIKIKK
ncbi:hypothetical protein [Methanobrevibacter sp. V14]|uniref:hypothetical protein n=1 Tax=Methanobrevibacter sp. V14 TaxID=3064280 RepID=UPI0027344CDB|nr:hypothetical protein [Methanobrevibacter sp. V14]